MRIGMPQSREHKAASEKNSPCLRSAVCFFVFILTDHVSKTVWTLCRFFHMYPIKKLHVSGEGCTHPICYVLCGFLTDGPMVNSLKEVNQLVDVLMSSSVGEVASEAGASFSSPCMLD